MDMQKIGKNIALLRKSKSMTQNELGERLGVTFQAVSKWERGETLPDTAILIDLSEILEVSVDLLLRGGEPAVAYRSKITVSDMINGLRSLENMGKLLGKDNIIYRYAISGINEGMNTDIQACFSDEYLFECFVTEAIIQNLKLGAYIDVSDIKNNFKHEHFRNIVLDYCKKYGIK